MTRYEKMMFVGPPQLPRNATWMVGPVLGASQLATDQSLGLKCQWPEMAAAATQWKGPQVKKRLPCYPCCTLLKVVKQPCAQCRQLLLKVVDL